LTAERRAQAQLAQYGDDEDDDNDDQSEPKGKYANYQVPEMISKEVLMIAQRAGTDL
jgi:hypothetical protein